MEDVTRADVAGEMEALLAWRHGMRKDWRAARDFLARRWPDRWQERRDQSVAAIPDAPPQTEARDQFRELVMKDPEVALAAQKVALAMQTGGKPLTRAAAAC